MLRNFDTAKSREFVRGSKVAKNPLTKSTDVSRNLFKLGSEERRGKELEMPFIELRQLIGRDKQRIKDGLVAQAQRKHEDPNATDYIKPRKESEVQAEPDMIESMEPTVTIITRINNANLSTLTEKDGRDSKKDLMSA